MINFRDFVPEKTENGGFFKAADYEGIQSVVEDANKWIEAGGIEVINVETVALPNIHMPYEEGSEDGALVTGEHGNYWHQFIRVWYR